MMAVVFFYFGARNHDNATVQYFSSVSLCLNKSLDNTFFVQYGRYQCRVKQYSKILQAFVLFPFPRTYCTDFCSKHQVIDTSQSRIQMFLGILRCGVVHSLGDFKKLTPMRPAEADYLGDFKTGCFCRDSSWVWHTLPKPTPTCLPISPFLWRCFAEVVFSLIFNHCLGTQRHLVPLTHPAVAAAAAHSRPRYKATIQFGGFLRGRRNIGFCW